MGKLLIYLIFVVLTVIWVSQPPYTVSGKLFYPLMDTPVKAHVIDTSNIMVLDEDLRGQAKLLNEKARQYRIENESLERDTRVLVKKVVQDKKKAERDTNKRNGDTLILVKVDVDTVYYPDSILVKKLPFEDKKWWGAWWRTNFLLLKNCTLHSSVDKYFKRWKKGDKGKKRLFIKTKQDELKIPSRDSSYRKEIQKR